MLKRMILMLVVLVAFLGAIGFVKFQQIQAAIAQSESFRPPAAAVTTIVAQEVPWETTLRSIGTITAVQGVTVSADLPGIVEAVSFDSGKWVEAGDEFVRLDTRQERARAAAEAERELARLNLERMRGLRAKGVVSQAELDAADARFKTTEAQVGQIDATIERKTIRAPFAGVLGLRQVNLGQYLAAGDPVVPLQSLDPIYVEFSVPQQNLSQVQVGTIVEVTIEGDHGVEVTGPVTAVDSIVNEATRNVKVQATLANPQARLHPGMFVATQVLGGAGTRVVALPASAISYAPYGDSVFVVEELEGPDGATYLGVRQQFVKLGGSRGDQVAVVSGVRPGEEVVTSGVFKLRNGAAVHVNNDVQPTNDPSPRPEES